MPTQSDHEQEPAALRACAGCPSATDLERCMNCRKAVEDSLTRVAGRRLRKLKRLPECSVKRLVQFLKTVKDRSLRFHLSTMAWWRFSQDDTGVDTSEIRKIMVASAIEKPAFGIAYMHEVLKLLSPLSAEQLTTWFGHESLHQVAAFYGGVSFDRDGVNCGKCRLYGQGCTLHNLLGADDCPLWSDRYVQDVAKAIAKAGKWKDPCRGVKEVR